MALAEAPGRRRSAPIDWQRSEGRCVVSEIGRIGFTACRGARKEVTEENSSQHSRRLSRKSLRHADPDSAAKRKRMLASSGCSCSAPKVVMAEARHVAQTESTEVSSTGAEALAWPKHVSGRVRSRRSNDHSLVPLHQFKGVRTSTETVIRHQ